MKKKALLLLVLLSVCLTGSMSAEIYKQVKVFLTDPISDIRSITGSGIDLEGAVRAKDNSIILFLNSSEFEKIKSSGLKYQVLIEDWSRYFNSLPKMSNAQIQQQRAESKEKYNVEHFSFGSIGGHYTLAEVVQQLDSMKILYPNLITSKIQIGVTNENRPLYAVKISKNPDISENEPQVLYFALTHAREPMGMTCLMYYMYYLLENYNTNPSVKYLVDNRELWFVPVSNPDGYEYNRSTDPNGGGLWRKNRRNNGGSYGIDLNRNYGPLAYWNAPNGGSSTTPSDDTYRGPSAFSEPETAAMRDFINSKHFKTSLSYHTYSNLCIYPYGALSRETPDSLLFREFAADITAWNGYEPGTDLQTVGYSTRGNSDDFLYDGDTTTRGKVFAMTLEVGTEGFWAPQDKIYYYAQQNLLPNLYYAWVAGEYVSLKNVTYSQQYINPGDNATMKFTLKNKGLSTGRNLSLQVQSLSQYAAITSGQINIDSIQARAEYLVPGTVSFAIAPNAPIQQKVKFVVKTFTGLSQMTSDTLTITLGTPSFVFRDTSQALTTNWTISASPATPTWSATTTTYYSAPNCFTDSKDGNYANNATVTMTLTNPINLTGLANPRLTFRSKWNIEKKWDCAVVLISSDNGSTWTALTGQFTKPASGSGKQVPAGMPMYDDVNNNWILEDIDLSAYVNQQVKLRFELRTDGSQVYDGWYLDDIGVYTYAAATNITWAGALSVKDAGTGLQNMAFGLAPSATNGIDLSLGEVSLPPMPPTGVFDARFELPVSPAEYSVKDYRRDTLNTAEWILKFQPGSAGYPVTISWNQSGLPAGTFTLKDIVTGTIVNVNMKTQGSYTLDNTGITALKIEYKKQACASLSLASGWNLVSVPYLASVMTPAQLFPQANSPMYAFANGYITPTALENGKGYWVRYASAATQDICGSPVAGNTVALASGWNLFGVYDRDILTSSLTTNPAGIINSVVYGYNQGYSVATTVASGKGYWVRTSQAGQLILPSGTMKNSITPYNIGGNAVARIQVSDNNGSSAVLYSVNSAADETNFDLPPLPPAGVFDVRYSNNSCAARIDNAVNEILISGAQYPVLIAAKTGSFSVSDKATGGKLVNQLVDASHPLRIAESTINALVIKGSDIPVNYELAQNFPNPFNPVTVIKFNIPEKTTAGLTVYNQLGQVVAKLVDGTVEAGYHQVEFNGSALSSGVYFYELRTEKFVSVKKLMLMK